MEEARQEVGQRPQADVTGAKGERRGLLGRRQVPGLLRKQGSWEGAVAGDPHRGWNTLGPTWSHEGAKADKFGVTCRNWGGFPGGRVEGQSG